MIKKITYTYIKNKPSTPHKVSYWVPKEISTKLDKNGNKKGWEKRFFRKTKVEALQLKEQLELKLLKRGFEGLLDKEKESEQAGQYRALLEQLPEEVRKPSQLTIAIHEWLDHIYMKLNKERMLIVADLYLEDRRKDVGDAYFKNRLKPVIAILTKNFSESLVCDIEVAEVKEIVEGLADYYSSSQSLDTKITDIKTFFSWCFEKNYIRTNITKDIKLTYNYDETPKHFEPEEIEKLFLTCLKTDPGMSPALALTFFGFLRVDEMKTICSSFNLDIRPEEKTIYVRREAAKGVRGRKKARSISFDGMESDEHLSWPLWYWVRSTDSIDTRNFIERRRAVHKKAEVVWFNSAARHCNLTYACQLMSPSRVADLCGHTTEKTAKERYRGIVSKGDAELVAQITPQYLSKKYNIELPDFLNC